VTNYQNKLFKQSIQTLALQQANDTWFKQLEASAARVAQIIQRGCFWSSVFCFTAFKGLTNESLRARLL
jgi:hypothetical protein